MAYLDGFDSSKLKIIAFDLDGTLLNASSKITKRTSDALVKAIEAGYIPVAATGRGYSTLPEDIFDVPGIEYVICANGAVVVELARIPRDENGRISSESEVPEEAVFYRSTMSEEDLAPIMDLICEEGLMREVFFGLKAYADKACLDNLEAHGVDTERRRNYIKRTRIPVDDTVQLIKDHYGELENINLDFKDLEKKQWYVEQLKSRSELTIVNSQHFNIEIGSPTTSKADALMKLAEKMGLSTDNIIAFGDSNNAISMIKEAAISVVMANGTEGALAEADLVAPANTEDGVAVIIEELLGIGQAEQACDRRAAAEAHDRK